MTSPNKNFDAAIVNVAARQLQEFAASNSDVLLAVLTSSDGFEVASYPSERAMTPRIAAMSSSMQALSEALTREAGLDKSRSLIIETDTGTVIVLGLQGTTPNVSLAVVASGSELLGKLLWATRNLCKTLETSLRQ